MQKATLKILVIRFSSIGDIIVTTPVVRWLKLQLHAEVHFITFNKYVSLLLNNPYIDQVIGIEKIDSTLKSKLELEKYTLVLDLHKNIRSHIVQLLLKKKAISYDKLTYKKWIATIFKINWLPKNKHLVDRYAESLSQLGIKNDGRGLDYHIVEEIIQYPIPEQYIVLVLGAAHATKRIPISKCKEILTIVDQPVVLIGGKDVINEGKALASEFTDALNLTGLLTINQSAIVMRNSLHVITGDTGMMHIAAALQKNITVLWGSTFPDFGMYPYYGSNKEYQSLLVEGLPCQPCSKIGKDKCPKGHHRCMVDQDVTKIKI
jgi:ADP-heptose:LPS heptosyltransferase